MLNAVRPLSAYPRLFIDADDVAKLSSVQVIRMDRRRRQFRHRARILPCPGPRPMPHCAIRILRARPLICGTLRSRIDRNNDSFGETRPNSYTLLPDVDTANTHDIHMTATATVTPSISP